MNTKRKYDLHFLECDEKDLKHFQFDSNPSKKPSLIDSAALTVEATLPYMNGAIPNERDKKFYEAAQVFNPYTDLEIAKQRHKRRF
jgi:hypothetical protein